MLTGTASKSMEFGETEFWEPVTVDTGDLNAKWMNEKMVLTQGRLLVDESKGRAYGMELRLFMMINGTPATTSTATSTVTPTATTEVPEGTATSEVGNARKMRRRRLNRV